jgi:hypothetical protein
MDDVGARRAPQHHRPLEHHHVPPSPGDRAVAAGPGDAAGRWNDQPVAEPHEQRLSRAVRPDHRRDAAARNGEGHVVEQPDAVDLEAEPLDDQRQDGGRVTHRLSPRAWRRPG